MRGKGEAVTVLLYCVVIKASEATQDCLMTNERGGEGGGGGRGRTGR